MSLLRTFSLCFLLMLLAGALPAQAQAPDEEEDQPLLRGSNRALSFSIDELKLGTLDGGIGARWWISQNSVLRATFSIGVESTEDVTEGELDTGRSAFGVGSSFLVELHRDQFRRVSPYIVAGTGVHFDAYSETIDFDPESAIQRQRLKGTLVDFFVKSGFGVEVYLVKTVSISAEHLFVATVRTGQEEIKRTPLGGTEFIVNRDIREFFFTTGTSSLLLSVYF